VSKHLHRKLLFTSACAGILVFGIVLAVLGTVFGMTEMRARLQVSLAQQGDLILVLYLGIFIASLVVGPLIDHVGNRLNLAVSSALVTVAMLCFSAATSFSAAAGASLLLGLGGGGLNTCTNALVSELYGDERGPMLNALGIFFGLGALFVPLLGASIEGRFTINQLFLFCATLSGICVLAYAVMSFPPASATQEFSWRDTLGVAKYPGVLLLGFILFCEAGDEASIAGWTSTYANVNGFAPRIATLVLAGYWAALMLGRMLAAALLRAVGKIQVVMGCAAIAALGGIILLRATSLPLLVLGIALIGFSYGPIFPTTLAIAGDRYSKDAGTIFGLLFSIALVGGMAFPWAVGQASEHLNVKTGMLVPLLGAAAICVLSACSRLRRDHDLQAMSTRSGTP
jgi:FHS family glucose/mannose:H+ symporter-like MFS transporter